MFSSLIEYIKAIDSNKSQIQDVLLNYKNKAENSISNKENIFLRLEENIQIWDKESLLKWATIVIKDNIMTEWNISSCGSKMLENYVSPYTATCIQNLQKNWWTVLAKTNMDEFAMWSTWETSYFGYPTNLYWKDRTVGGSSSGSAIAVAKGLCLGALWTDTWWSIRQPSAFCGVVGLKPTYGRVSRYGVQSMASSLDQVGVITKTVDDAEILLKSIMWFDPKDSQSDPKADEWILPNKAISNYKIAVPKQFLWDWLDSNIKNKIQEIIENLRSQWIQVDEIDLPALNHVVSAYYTIMSAEVSSNLSRFDGIRFGLQKDTKNYENIHDYYSDIRSEWFGYEVKKRILLWTNVLSGDNRDKYHTKALNIRQMLIHNMENIFEQYDLILSPTTPTVAWKIWKKSEDFLQTYLADIYTVLANLAGLPAISIPAGFIQDDWENMPVGIQLMANKRQEASLLSFSKEIEKMS